MKSQDVLRAFRERWTLLLAAALIAGIAAYGYTKLPFTEPRWRSSVSVQASGRLGYGNLLAVKTQLRPLADRVRQLSVMRAVNDNLHTDLAPEKMLANTKADPAEDSAEIHIDYEDSDALRAERVAVEIANSYVEQHNAAQEGLLREERVTLTVLDRETTAVLIWPLTRIIVPAAMLLGLLAAAVVIVASVYLDDTLKTAEDVQTYLGLPTIGSVPQAAGERRRLTNRQPPHTAPLPRPEAPLAAAHPVPPTTGTAMGGH